MKVSRKTSARGLCISCVDRVAWHGSAFFLGIFDTSLFRYTASCTACCSPYDQEGRACRFFFENGGWDPQRTFTHLKSAFGGDAWMSSPSGISVLIALKHYEMEWEFVRNEK